MSAGTFRIVRRAEEPLPHRAREAHLEGHIVFRGGSGFEVVIPGDAVKELHALARHAAPREFLGGVYGALYQDAQGTYAVVTGVVAVLGATTTQVTAAASPAAVARSESVAETRFPGARRVGWCHSHPRMGTCYSDVDIENQASYRSPFTVGIVVDPWCREDHGLGVYRGEESERLALVSAPPRRDVVPMRRTSGVNTRSRSERPVTVPAGGPPASQLLLAACFATMLAIALIACTRLEALESRIDALERDARTAAASGAPSGGSSPSPITREFVGLVGPTGQRHSATAPSPSASAMPSASASSAPCRTDEDLACFAEPPAASARCSPTSSAPPSTDASAP